LHLDASVLCASALEDLVKVGTTLLVIEPRIQVVLSMERLLDLGVVMFSSITDAFPLDSDRQNNPISTKYEDEQESQTDERGEARGTCEPVSV